MFHCAKQRQHGPKSRSAMFPKTRAQVSIWSHREENCWQRGFLRKYPLRWLASHKSRLWHERFLLSVQKKMVADEKKGRKTVQWATIQMKCRFCMYDLCVCVLQLKKKKGKDEKWREINITGLAGLLFHLANWDSAPLQPSHYPGIQS